MTHVLEEIQDLIDTFNSQNATHFQVDSIRVDFSKEHKLNALKNIGRWEKIGRNSPLLPKLKKRLLDDEVTSAHRLSKYEVYYYSLQDPPKYRKARMVIFGMAQYHKAPTPASIIKQVLQVLKDVANIDVCIDFGSPPNLKELSRHFTLARFMSSAYINEAFIPMIERIVFYDKALKNALGFTVWRMEATISIPNWKALALPLDELKAIAAIAWGRS